MNTIYKFYLQINDGEKHHVRPIYKDNLSINFELEDGQRFYRKRLTGKLTFVRDDYELIISANFEAEYFLYIEKSDDFGETYSEYYKAKFMRTDCSVNIDDKSIEILPQTVDDYEDVLSGIEKEYNIIDLAPEIDRMLIRKRPLIQVYLPGDNIVSCFLGGETWEEDSKVITDVVVLDQTYYFGLMSELREILVTGLSSPNVGGTYVGKKGGAYYNNEGYYLIYEDTINKFSIYDPNDQLRFQTDTTIINDPAGEELIFLPIGSSTGIPVSTGVAKDVYGRYLLDVEKLKDLQTYELPDDDIVGDNKNYKRAIGYSIDLATISNNFSDDPTKYGKATTGKYFKPPFSVFGQKYYPIARSNWTLSSIWFAFHFNDESLEKAGRKVYTLKDAYPVSSAISVLLKEIAPEITHEPTEEYSKFLYAENNPISGVNTRLYVTAKSNILIGEYQVPAQKVKTTLKDFTNMLLNCYQCYWYIEDKKFKIEHVKFFKNGGSYVDSPVISIDLTKLKNTRNQKSLSFATSKYTFNKEDMAERFQFSWMDDVTDSFEGIPIEIISKYVTPGKIEEINISNFTSDIDFMILNPEAMNKDGFAIFSAIKSEALEDPDKSPFDAGTSANSGELSEPTYKLVTELNGYNANAIASIYHSGPITFSLVFYSGGIVVSEQATKVLTGTGTFNLDENVFIPQEADEVGFKSITGAFSAHFWGLKVSEVYELPFVDRIIDGVTYLLQNGYLAFVNLQPNYWIYDLPAKKAKINNLEITSNGIKRNKKQVLSFPVGSQEINPLQLVKTELGNGQVNKISLNLSSRTIKANLDYDTE